MANLLLEDAKPASGLSNLKSSANSLPEIVNRLPALSPFKSDEADWLQGREEVVVSSKG